MPYSIKYSKIHTKGDLSDDFIVSYDDKDKANFICFVKTNDNSIMLDGHDLCELGCYELFIKFYELDRELDLEKAGYASNKLGLSVTYGRNHATDEFGNDIFYEALETLTIATKSYWKQEKL